MSDPVTIAREVLDAEELHDGTPANEADLREERWEFYEDLCTSQAPDLARAVIAVAELADRLDDGHLRHLIRTTLNGETA